ncbi:carbohydrate ABC transporter permease [Anaerocolumna xylanovorans]|uniref:Alpha-1,4-digalacturonate transport system permease protein n=1 Tax=Anaerocolumna xylanovorans DSM 12503 TaxID=1121345 RepID=A0A1M7YNR3_9FIRM|nr:sugar ABC transporter permease [Anaerocolumna xylanovorans]SHO54235.1 alpha-1,4-digalacturonate transport system permease protein [Anaerocolumna xylanovorans DSM 12503]
MGKRLINKRDVTKQHFWNNVKVVPYLYILPNMILFLTFMIIPLFMSAYYSLTKWGGMGKPKFIGLENYVKLFKNDVFLISLLNTLKLTVATVPMLMALALFFAIFLNQKLKFRGFFRSAIYMPAVVSMVSAGMVFVWMFNSQIGLINFLLKSVGLPVIDWLNDPKYAMIMIIVGTLWIRTGYNMVIYIAGLQGISPEYYEAATVDGAGKWQQFRYITMPLLTSSHLFIFITCVIYSFRSFDLIYVMTKGGPLNSTKTLVVYIYDAAFQKNQYGSASAAGIVLFFILLIFTIIRFKMQKER